MKVYRVINPATNETVSEYPGIDDSTLETALASADLAYRSWRTTSVEYRAGILGNIADLVERDRDSLAEISMREVGKTKPMALAELGIVIRIFRHYSVSGQKYLQSVSFDSPLMEKAEVRKDPVGVILGIEPWNYPYYQVTRVVAPNLLLGNTVMVKPASQCPESAMQFDRIFAEAGLPPGVYQTALISSGQAAAIIADPRLKGVALTGSEAAGAAVAAVAGQNLKKCILELGGSDPYVVLDSADLGLAVQSIVMMRANNVGQSCNAPKRLIVTPGIAEAFIQALSAAVGMIKVGDQFDPTTTMGPLSSVGAAAEVQGQLDDAIAQGVTVLVPGGRQAETAFFDPVVLTDITPDMRIFTEEVFGPVFAIYRAKDAEDAIRIANDTVFGLGAAVFGQDLAEAMVVADAIESGMVFINIPETLSPEMPFGGVKRSGIGREQGVYAVDEFANHRLVGVGKTN